MGAVALLQRALQLGERGDHGGGGAVGVATLERHGAVGHLAVEVDAQAQRTLGDVADLAALGLAADRSVDAVGVAAGDEVAHARHHPLLVDEGGDDEPAGERPGTHDGVGREQHRRQAGLHVGRAAPPDPPVAQLGAERVDGPVGGSPSVTTSVWPSKSSVGPGPSPSIVAMTLGRPSATRSTCGAQPNARIRASTSSAAGASLEPARRVEHAGDAHQLTRELDELLGVDPGHGVRR